METVTVAIQRWIAHRRLTRGQCRACRRILRDDVLDRFCSEGCASMWSLLFCIR
jgi:hypothetical protein